VPTQTTDITADPFGIVYTANGETWQVAKGVSVFGKEVGVSSEFLDSTLKNKGSITGNGAGVVFDADGGTTTYLIKNTAKGSIEGGEAAVAFVDFLGSATLDNAGSIGGIYSGVYFGGSSAISLSNTGTISGGYLGLGIDGETLGSSGPTVDNYGKIEGGLIGVQIEGDVDFLTMLTNHKGGTIKSSAAAIASETQLHFTNDGKVKGSIFTWDAADTVINKAKIDGDVGLGEGIDTFKNKGKATAGLVDTGDGNDLVVLGKKADTLLFASDLDSLTNVDTVKKFTSGQDKLYLSLDIFTELTPGTLSSSQFHKGTAAADADDRIIYDKASGALYYDADGSGAGAQVQFARLDGGPKLKASDFTIGEYSLVL